MQAMKGFKRLSFNRRHLSRVFGILFTVALVSFLLANTDISAMWKMVTGVAPGWLLIACFPFLLNKLCRAIQFLILTGTPGGHWLWMTAVVCAQSLANQIFPARTGEFSYIYFVNRGQKVGVGSGVTSLLVVRLLDVLTIAGLFSISSVLSLGSLPGEAQYYVFIAISAMVVLMVVILALVVFHRSFCALGVRLLERCLPSWGIFSWRPRLVKLIGEIDQSLSGIQSVKQIGALTALSLVFWILMFGLNHILLLALDLDVAFKQTIIGSTFGAFTSLIPVSAVGNLGTLEAGWTAGFVLAGLDTQIAIFSGFAVHILSFFYTAIFGFVGLTLVMRVKSQDD